jgi:DNA-binding NtrC family response regulator
MGVLTRGWPGSYDYSVIEIPLANFRTQSSSKGTRLDTPGHRILIVDDEKDICDLLFRLLKKNGYVPLVAHDGEGALQMIRMGMPDLVVSDVRMPGMDGMELLRRSKQFAPDLPVLMITGYAGIDGAIQAVRQGALDYLPKPFDVKELLEKIKRGIGDGNRARRDTVPSEAPALSAVTRLREMMGPSGVVRRIVSEVALVAPSDFTVVIQGETGTGKELVAGAIHRASGRSQGPFVPVDCGAIPESLFESELFGHEKGAFTGAVATTAGKFELAQGGTLFLDEIANMPPLSQTKLLRAIQEKKFFRVGGKKEVTVDLRLVVASNRDLNAAVNAGSFSRDLFYRLSEFTVVISPIRERSEDIIHLADRFLRATNVELVKNIQGFSESAVDALIRYNWPGNVRQIKSVVRRAVLVATDLITPEHLALPLQETSAASPTDPSPSYQAQWSGIPLKEAVHRATAEVERRCLVEALRRTGGNKAKAARLLEIDRKTLHTKIKDYNIRTEEEESPS